MSESTEERLGIAVQMHSGVHTGPVVAQRQRSGDRRFRITGAPLDVASRLAAFAAPDEILITPECQRLVFPFIDATPGTQVTLQSDGAPITPHRVDGESDVQSRLELAERAGLTPFAGRSRELSSLEEQLAAATVGRGCTSVVIGDAGSGKSRLLHELRRGADLSGMRLVQGRCDAYGGNTPYLPFVQIIRELLGVRGGEHGASAHDSVAKHVHALDPSLSEFLPLYLALLSIPGTTHPLPRHLQGEHLQAAMLEALAALVTLQAQRDPIVLLLEDWHWADEASRAALDRMSEIAPAYPLLVIVTSRPEVEWKAEEHRTLVHLGPLSAKASAEIICAVFDATNVAPDLAQQLHERTGGNPFFLEETCQALREEDAVVVRGGRAEAAGASGAVHFPETVQSVIRTRLDRLDPVTRDTLRMASVIGREFARGVLEAVASATPNLAEALDHLRAAGLVQQISVMPEPVFRFKHVLTQEVAYDTLLEHQRRSLHAAAARAIEQRYAGNLDERLERLAQHFSHAEEWKLAVEYGIRAADRAKALSHFGDALGTLDQAQEWLSRLPDSAERRDLLADVHLRQERLCETLGHRARQLTLVGELIALLAPHGGSTRLAEAYLRQGDVFTLLRRFDAADRALGTSLLLSRELGDRTGERNAIRSMGLLRSHEGRREEAIVNIEQALALDLELGETTAAAGDVASLGNLLRDMGRYQEALEALEQALNFVSPDSDPNKWCAVVTVIASVYRDLGDTDAALRHLERARDMAVERRLPIIASFSVPTIAHIMLEQGRVEESLATYRQAIDLSRRARHGEGLAQTLRAIGEVLFGLGRYTEALPHLEEAAELFAQLEHRETQKAIWQRLASAHERCSQFAEGEAVWQKVRAQCEADADSMGETVALEGIARCARHRGVRASALAQYESALARATAAGQQEREVTLHNTLGLLRWEDGMYEEALRHYEAALRLCRAREDRVHEGLILNSLGATLLRLRRYDEARTALEEGARANRKSGQRQLEAHSEAVLGQVLLVLGRAREARKAIERSLAIRPELGDRRGEGWMFEHLARALQAEGRQEEALVARDAARAIAGEVNDAALNTALDALAVQPAIP
jgi:tetratricopeptide (TPR) repeat protein